MSSGFGTWGIFVRQKYSENAQSTGGPDLKISIVIPNYNSGEVLRRALDSLFSQDYSDLEVIIVDSASTDASRQIIERHRTEFDILIIEKDRGQADGLNRGFARATGDIFGWLCADDELLPGALNHIAHIFAAQPSTEVLLGACERVYVDGSRVVIPPVADPWQKIGLQDVIEQPSTFWRAGLHQRCGLLDMRYQLAFDWDFWCRMGELGAHVTTTDQILSRYYFSQDNKTSRSGNLFAREAFMVIRDHGPLRGGLAYIYWSLYKYFDLHGCYDKPPSCTRIRAWIFAMLMRLLCAAVGTQLIYMYNWHFASLQQRGKQWW